MIVRKQKRKLRQYLLAVLFTILGAPAIALAAQSQSSNYQVNEVFFGAGGTLESCSSGNYCSKQAAGELAVGQTSSTNYQAHAGFNTDRTPYIQMTVNNTNIDLGTLNASSTATATAGFSVEAYLAHGYSVVNASDPPQNGSYNMHALAVPSAAAPGTEQFGMNLVANTSPTTFGANPTYSPDNTFSFGLVDSAYSSTNLYKYAKGDTIAYSPSSTSFTNYTISYIFDVSNVTPGGTYTFHHVLVATGTY